MARKPKAAPASDAPPPAAVTNLARMDGAPAPARRGRKPKAAAASPEPDTTVDTSTAATDAVASDVTDMDEGDAPVRARRGRQPKQRADDAATSRPQDDAPEQPEAEAHQPEAAAEPAPTEGDVLIAEMAFPIGDAESGDASPSDIDTGNAADEAVPPSPGVDTAARTKPAARWDRATDTAQFDWPEIERTAAQDGPNQAMAKLLIAARAEGANSRWPL